MAELWDVYDINKKRTGKIVERDNYEFEKGEYHLVVSAVIMNSKNEILISKRAAHKKHPLKWEINGGSITQGEDSLEGILRELKEELGLIFSKEEAIFLKELRSEERYPNFKDMWLFRRDIDIEDVTFPDGEAIEAKWVSIDEFMAMLETGEIIPMVDFGREEYEEALTK